MPPEISGVPIVDGAQSLGVYYASVVDLIPRLEDEIGWLMYALTGKHSYTSGFPEAGLTTHVFTMDSTDYLALKYLTVRRTFPAPVGGNASGEQCIDAKIAAAVFTFAAAARMTARMTVYGREPSFSDSIGGWAWAGEPEGGESIAVASNEDHSHFKLPEFQAGELPSQLVRVSFGNQLTTPQQEFIIGSAYPADVVALYRNIAIEAVYQWEDEDLYLQLVAAGGSGATIPWSPQVYYSDFTVKAASGGKITGKNYPYSLEIKCPKVYWFPSAPPEIAGVNLIQLPMTGIVARPSTGLPFEIHLVNDTIGTAYTWPTP